MPEEPSIRIPLASPDLSGNEQRYLMECVTHGMISSIGAFVSRFEAAFADFCGTAQAVATNSGTAALHLALCGLEIGPGDEVIVPTLTFVATANAVRYTGATPVFVDVDPTTWTLDPGAVCDAITPRTRAIIAVHLFGIPGDMHAISAVAERHNLFVIEDAAQAHGAGYAGRRVGSLGHAGVFSFHGGKTITTGEGGAVVTDDAGLADRLRHVRNHGTSPSRRYWHTTLGYNYRMSNVQAALGVAQLERAGTLLAAKRRIAATYERALADTDGIRMPAPPPHSEPIMWVVPICIDADRFGATRKHVREALRAAGIETRPMFPPLHTQPIYSTAQTLPVAEKIARCGLSLPAGVTVADDTIIDIVSTLKQCQYE